MNAIAQASLARRNHKAYTLIELLCSIGIVLLLAAMLLPVLRNGNPKAQRIYCVNNLREMGMAFQSFAHTHQDRFPMQVSTNDGGSQEFLRAANTSTGEFYASYQHFLPLSNDLATPKVLDCPTDKRRAATNFAQIQNDNLSYFVAGNPEIGKVASMLAGNRNVAPVFGSVASVSEYRRLRWTEELHRFKGNVLFCDGHVEQMNDVLSATNYGLAAGLTSLHLPTVKAEPSVPNAGGVSGWYEYAGNRGAGTRVSATITPGFTNQFGTNKTVTNFWVSGSTGKGSWRYYPGSGSGDSGGADSASVSSHGVPLGAPGMANRDTGDTDSDPWSLKGVYNQVVDKGQAMARQAGLILYRVPWYLLLLLIVALIEIRRRIRAAQRASSR